MSYFKCLPSCSSCEYADLYIPYFTYPFHDPYCVKGHGKCEVDKVCDDYRLINTHYCSECEFMSVKDDKDYCRKNNVFLAKINESCVYFIRKENKVSFND